MERPVYFRDEMIAGAFRRFSHEHMFEAIETNKTKKTDILEISAPFGLLGLIAEHLFLGRYMQNFIREKNSSLKHILEERNR